MDCLSIAGRCFCKILLCLASCTVLSLCRVTTLLYGLIHTRWFCLFITYFAKVKQWQISLNICSEMTNSYYVCWLIATFFMALFLQSISKLREPERNTPKHTIMQIFIPIVWGSNPVKRNCRVITFHQVHNSKLK